MEWVDASHGKLIELHRLARERIAILETELAQAQGHNTSLGDTIARQDRAILEARAAIEKIHHENFVRHTDMEMRLTKELKQALEGRDELAKELDKFHNVPFAEHLAEQFAQSRAECAALLAHIEQIRRYADNEEVEMVCKEALSSTTSGAELLAAVNGAMEELEFNGTRASLGALAALKKAMGELNGESSNPPESVL